MKITITFNTRRAQRLRGALHNSVHTRDGKSLIVPVFLQIKTSIPEIIHSVVQKSKKKMH